MTPPANRLALLGIAIILLSDITTPDRADAADWKPAKGPLMTRWAKDVTPDKVLPEYPRPQMVRKDWQNLNGLWEFATADESRSGGRIRARSSCRSRSSRRCRGVGKHSRQELCTAGRSRSRRSGKGKRVLLHFGAVDCESTVWVNGKELGKHVGGYDAFSFDITDALKDGGEQEAGRRRHRHDRRDAAARQADHQPARHLVHAGHRHLADGVDRAGAEGRASID